MARVDLGERIASLREEQALTQADLAERARISPSTLSQIESGKVPRPHVGTIRKIARALGVEPQDLRRVEEEALAEKAEAPPVGAVPNSLDELLKVRGVRTRHLANENLKGTLDKLPLEAAVQIVREVSAEMEAIGADLASLRDQHAQNNKAMRLWNDAVQRFLIARYSLRAKRGQEFVPVELEAEFDQTMQDLEEAEVALAGVG